MTISQETGRMIFSGNEVKTEFNYSHTFFSADDLKVTHYNTLTGVETALQPWQYDIAYEGDPPYTWGTITYPLSGAPMSYDEQLIVYRAAPLEQGQDLTNQQAYFLESIEHQLDRNVIMIQDLADRLNRAPVLPVSTPPWKETFLGMPQPGYFLRWSDDPNDNILESVDIAQDIIDQILSDEGMQDLIIESFDTPEYNIAFAREWDVHVAAGNVPIDRGWILAGTDWDNLVESGFYRYDGAIYTGQINLPAGISDYGILSVEVSGDHIRQFYSEAPPAEASTYMCTCINGVWSAWGMALAIPPGGGGGTIVGLDADMVDGQHCLPETMPADGLLKIGDYGVTHTVLDVNASYTDMNELVHSGTFYISTGTNAPFNEDWAVAVTRYDDNWLRQTAYNFWYPEEIYVRTRDQYNGWSDWCFILTDTNIGWVDIDADTVDGKHAEDHPMPQEGLIQVGTYGVTYQALDITGFDWDTMTVSGVYQATSPTNAPYDDDWYLEVVRASDTQVLQKAYNFYMPEEVYYRLYDGGVWGSWNRVWAGTLGDGSGLNADQVDGYDVDSSPAPMDGLLKVGDWGVTMEAMDITGFDLNSMTQSGVFHGSNPANAPYSDDWYVEVVRASATQVLQKAYCYYVPEDIYVRLYDGGVWGAWVRVWTGALGDGSGLDADSVDGIEGVDILQKNSVNGSFTTADGKTVSVVDGQIASVIF